MVYHTRAVARGSQQALIVADMPFMSYQTDIRDARIKRRPVSSRRAEPHSVKLEGGEHMAETIKSLVDIDIPVMAHIGLTPTVDTPHGRLQGSGGARKSRLARSWLTPKRLNRPEPSRLSWKGSRAIWPNGSLQN